MIKVENILVAADLSPHSSSVVNRGFVLAKTLSKSRLTIFHATGIDALNSLPDLLRDKKDAVTNKILDDPVNIETIVSQICLPSFSSDVEGGAGAILIANVNP